MSNQPRLTIKTVSPDEPMAVTHPDYHVIGFDLAEDGHTIVGIWEDGRFRRPGAARPQETERN